MMRLLPNLPRLLLVSLLQTMSKRSRGFLAAAAVGFGLLGFANLIQGADAYGNALDKRFAAGSQDSPSAKIAALEDGLRTQVQQMSQPASLTPVPVHETVDSVFLWEMIMAFAVGIVALVFMRSWHKSLFPPPTRRAANLPAPAEDAAMAELVTLLHPGAVQTAGAGGSAGIEPDPKNVAGVPPAPPAPAAAPIKDLIASLSDEFKKLSKANEEPGRTEVLSGLVRQIQTLKEACGLAGLRSIWLLSSALHGLLKQFSTRPDSMTPSAMRTSAAAIDLIEFLSTRQIRPELATDPPVRLLAVDDEPISRRAVAVALKKIFNEPDIAPDGPSALALAAQNSYDVVFLDIEMPGMDGFEVCTRLHELDRNKVTPVVFVTTHQDFQSRAKSAVVGANDLMGKPFQAFEIALKALTLVVRSRAAQESGSILNAPSSQESFVPKTAVALPAPELAPVS